MEAPDKIYVPVITSMLTRQQNLHCEWQYSPSSFADENIEYIRKDLLLEWAKEMEKRAEYKFDDDNGDMCWGYDKSGNCLLFEPARYYGG